MAKQFKLLTEKHINFIKQQHIFLVGTAGAEGYVNVSPNGYLAVRQNLESITYFNSEFNKSS